MFVGPAAAVASVVHGRMLVMFLYVVPCCFVLDECCLVHLVATFLPKASSSSKFWSLALWIVLLILVGLMSPICLRYSPMHGWVFLVGCLIVHQRVMFVVNCTVVWFLVVLASPSLFSLSSREHAETFECVFVLVCMHSWLLFVMHQCCCVTACV